jgi:hypothetical protein
MTMFAEPDTLTLQMRNARIEMLTKYAHSGTLRTGVTDQEISDLLELFGEPDASSLITHLNQAIDKLPQEMRLPTRASLNIARHAFCIKESDTLAIRQLQAAKALGLGSDSVGVIQDGLREGILKIVWSLEEAHLT